MGEVFRRRPLLAYAVIAFSIVSLVVMWQMLIALSDPGSVQLLPHYFKWLDVQRTYVNIITITRYGLAGHPAIFLIFLYASAPSVSALIVTYVAFGPEGLGRLISRFKPWSSPADRPRALLAYVILFGVFFAGIAGLLAILRFATPLETFHRTLDNLGGSFLMIVPVAILGAFTDEGASLEELGWRGFALPLFQAKFKSPLKATLALGTLWWAWHLPREIPGLVAGEDIVNFVTGQAAFLSLVIGLAIIATCMVNMTGGSILPAIIVHGGTNVWSKALEGPWLPSVAKIFDARTLIVYALALLVLIVAGPNLGLRRTDPA